MTNPVQVVAERVRAALLTRLPDATVEFDFSIRARLVVHLVSASFAELDDVHRQIQVWGWLQSDLAVEDRHAISFVFTLTPAEQDAFLAADGDAAGVT